jgi:hypothetical protein
MKPNVILAVSGIGLLLAGCITANHGMVLEGVGPDPNSAPNMVATSGTLLVYSAYEVNADFNIRDPHRPQYTDYQILTTDGKLHQRVHNSTETILQRPRLIDLPVGTYCVIAEANGFGSVTVPVTIQAGKDTILHLEGGDRWPNPQAFNQSNAVRLPDGQVVGWKSTVAMK